jgi:hypothetical protein
MSLTPEEKQTMLSKHNAHAMVRRNTPCADSIAIRCPNDVSSYKSRLSIGANASSIVDVGASAPPKSMPDASHSVPTPDYTNETDGKYEKDSLLCVLSTRQLLTKKFSSAVGEYITRTMSDKPITIELTNIPQGSSDQQADDMRNGAHEMTQESRAQRRSRERAHKQIMASHEMQRDIAHRRASRQNIPHGERHAQQQRSNASFASKQTTPHAKISDAATSSAPSPASNTLISPPETDSASTPAYTIGTEGNSPILIIFTYPYALLNYSPT